MLRVFRVLKMVRVITLGPGSSLQRQIGVLITDHNVRETLGICDRAYIINQGSVLASGSPNEIIANESVRRVYLGEHFRM